MVAPDSSFSFSNSSSTVIKKINIWKDRLQDLSGRNRLLYFKPTRASTLEIVHPSLELLFDLLVRKAQVLEFPVPEVIEENETLNDSDSGDEIPEITYGPNEIGVKQDPKRINRILYNLRTRARTAQEEQGINILYLAVGFLRWYETETSSPSKAPLIMIPVNINRVSSAHPYSIQVIEDDIVLNPSLVVKLRNDFKIALPDLPELKRFDDVENYFGIVESKISDLKNWNVSSEAVINTFNFQNLIIIQDIEQNHEIFVNNSIIQAISFGQFENPEDVDPDSFIEAHELDQKVSPTNSYQVFLADSSQQATIEAAKSGANLIIQGPPGTGKSQTIANLIAEFLALDKKILFVSQKAEALDVVKNRLQEVGLDEFCLMVHSHKRSKLDVIRELGEALDTQNVFGFDNNHPVISELESSRNELNRYVRLLHKPFLGLGLTPFQLYGQLAAMEQVDDLRFSIPMVEAISEVEKNDDLNTLGEFIPFSSLLVDYERAEWIGVGITELPLELAEKLEETFDNIIGKVQSLDGYLEELALVFGLQSPTNLLGAVQILRVARTYTPSVFSDATILEIHSRFSSKYGKAIRYLMPAYWKDRRIMQQHSRESKLPGYHSLLQDISYITALIELKTEIDQASEDEKEAIFVQLDYFSQIAQEINSDFNQLMKMLGSPATGQDYLNGYIQMDIEFLLEVLQRKRNRINLLHDWVHLNTLLEKIEGSRLKDFVTKAIEKGLHPNKWKEIYLKRLYLLAMDIITRENIILGRFNGNQHENLIELFRQRDEERIQFAILQIIQKVRSSRPDASWMKTGSTETALLRREMNKKRRIKALRRLFAEIPELLVSLKPCLMMSPYTVSQLLDPKLFNFDIVLFDEASQIPPEYAIGGITRAKQVIIAGDPKQLPPTRFFQTMEITSDEDEDIYDEFESILNEALAIGMPESPLKWHYRSRDESLIAFSNYHFYNNNLYTFPNPNTSDELYGIQFQYVEGGVYRRGTGRDNLVEAREVVKGVIEHFEKYPDKSLGVVTFNQAQKQAIDAELDRVLRDNQHLQTHFDTDQPHPFFVKNLESVQGDERDYIFFSIGFGRDEAGKFHMNFGPLNKSGGERRLNVAVTRARYGVKIFSSIQPEDIDLNRTDSQGAKLLRSYLEVARDGVKAVYRDTSVEYSGEFGSPFEQAVYQSLVNAGLEVRSQIGVSGYRIDLAIVDPQQPGRYLLGIECDGAMYHSAATARDRDRLRQEVLEGLGWTIHRIWSRDWFKDSDKEVEKVLTKVAAIQGGDHDPSRKMPEPTNFQNRGFLKRIVQPTKHENNSKPKETVPYTTTKLGTYGHGAADFWRAYRWDIQEIIIAVVRQESPILESLVIRRVADAFNIRRITQKFERRLHDDIIRLEIDGKLDLKDGFLWSSEGKAILVRTPVNDEDHRSVDEIPLEEIAEAAYICVQTALSIEPDHLLKEIGNIFDLRVTEKARKRFIEGARLLQRSGRITWRSDKIRLPQN